MSGPIFISYRRDDASSAAGRLYDRLSAQFSDKQIFFDIDNIDYGIDFVKAIEESVASCEVLVAVIGRHWLESSDEQGRRRLDNPEDFVRVEIGTALKRDIRFGLVWGPRDTMSDLAIGSLQSASALQVAIICATHKNKLMPQQAKHISVKQTLEPQARTLSATKKIR